VYCIKTIHVRVQNLQKTTGFANNLPTGLSESYWSVSTMPIIVVVVSVAVVVVVVVVVV
jgi:hypothetical protein